MYVTDLDIPWEDSPFMLQSFDIKNGEDINQVMELKKRADKHGKAYWVIDPYNAGINTVPFNSQAPPLHIQLSFSAEET